MEGNLRVSTAIKYLTQSTWSHSAMYVGDVTGARTPAGESRPLIEADLVQGVIAVPLSKYRGLNVRICRAVGLTPEYRKNVVRFMVQSLGKGYDLKNVWNPLRYLLPTPPVPIRVRRRMLAIGSGDPTRAICSTLIAQAFEQVRYPILPDLDNPSPTTDYAPGEIISIRHHSLFAPRDFDLSPYFAIVKPTLERGFDYRRLQWSDPNSGARSPG